MVLYIRKGMSIYLDTILDIKKKLYFIFLIAIVLISTSCNSKSTYNFDEEQFLIKYGNDNVGTISETDNSDYCSSVEFFMKVLYSSDVSLTNIEYRFSENNYKVYIVDAILPPNIPEMEMYDAKEESIKLYVAINENISGIAYELNDHNYTDDFENSLKKHLAKM